MIQRTISYSLLAITLMALVACSGTKKISNISAFDNEQLAMITTGDSLTPMRVYKINNYSDSLLLRTKSTNVDINANDPNVNLFVKRLYATVRDSMSMGVGIAAPQVGILKNIIWIQRFDKEGFPFEVYINPRILSYSKLKQDCREGCLSIPDRSDTTRTRSYAIMIDYDRMDGTHHTEMIEDFTAVIFQHEIDHLNGILYLDHLEKEVRAAKRSPKKLKKINRAVVKENKEELLNILDLKSFNGKRIVLETCINPSGVVVYAELLKKTTVSIPKGKEKAVLKSLYSNLIFEKGSQEEECGIYVVE